MKVKRVIMVETDGAIEELAWAPDSGRLAVLNFPLPVESREGTEHTGIVQIYDAIGWEVMQTLPTTIVRTKASMTWSPDGCAVATISLQGVTIWKVETGQVLYELYPAEGETYSVAWSPDGKYLAVSLIDAQRIKIDIWNLSIRSVSSSLFVKAGVGGIGWMAWSPDAAHLAAIIVEMNARGFVSHKVSIWDVANEEILQTFPFPSGVFEGLGQSHGWSPDGKCIAIATGIGSDPNSGQVINEGKITIWDVTSGRVISMITMENKSLRGAAWSPDDTRLASTTGDEILVFEPNSGKLVHRYPSLFPEEPPEDQIRQIGEFRVYMTMLGFTNTLAWSPDGKTLVAGNVGGMKVWTFGEHGK